MKDKNKTSDNTQNVNELPSDDFKPNEFLKEAISNLSKNDPHFSKKAHNALSYYLKQITRFPLLKHDQELKLLKAYFLGKSPDATRNQIIGSEIAKQKLLKSNLRLVVSVARKYHASGIDLIDLIQEGNLGLIKALDKFDCSLGYKFSTYATWWIRQSITKAISEKSRVIRLPNSVQEAMVKIKKAKEGLPSSLGREPNIEDLSKATGLSSTRIQKVYDSDIQPLSLDINIGNEQDSSLTEIIEQENPEPTPEEKSDQKLLSIAVNEAIENILTDREKEIIRLRYRINENSNTNEERSLSEVAAIIGVSLERVRQIEARAIYKLRNNTATRKKLILLMTGG